MKFQFHLNNWSLAYSALTGLNPVHGLYTTFFSGLVYVIFGTSRHLSVGTYSVTSLMVYSSISRVELRLHDEMLAKNNVDVNSTQPVLIDLPNKESVKIQISSALVLWCGIFQVFLIFFVVIYHNFFFISIIKIMFW